MAIANYYNIGTISVAAGAVNVTGNGTTWGPNIRADDILWVGGRDVRIASVTDNTHIILASGWPGPVDLVNAAYEIRVVPPSSDITIGVRAVVESLADGIINAVENLPFVESDFLIYHSGALYNSSLAATASLLAPGIAGAIHFGAGTTSAPSINFGGTTGLSNATTGRLDVSASGARVAAFSSAGLGLRSSGAAFDLVLHSAEVLTADRVLTVAMGDAARTLTFSGSPTLSGITTTGTATLATGSGTLTFQGTDTYVGRATTDTLTNKSLTSPAITSPTISGGTHTALTSLGIRSSGAAFDLALASVEVLTAGRTLTLSMGDANRTLTFTGSPTLSGVTVTGTATIAAGTGTLTFQGTDTYVGRATADTLTNKTINASSNTLSNITTTMLAASAFSTDGTLLANSATIIPSQSAVKTYVDAAINGFAWKPAVACLAATNIALSGEQTIDGILTSNSRVLVKNQTLAYNNGIWISSSGAWSRAPDANSGPSIAGASTVVEGGTVYSETVWNCNNTSITLGTTAITFVSAGSVAVLAGTGLSLSGTTMSIATNGVTYALMQQVAASSLMGNPTGSTANAQGITLGSTLAFSGSVLQTTAHTGDVTSSANSNVMAVAKIAGTTVSGTTGSGNVMFSASPTATGTFTAASISAASVTVSSTLGVTGATTLGNSLTVSGLSALGAAAASNYQVSTGGHVAIGSAVTANVAWNGSYNVVSIGGNGGFGGSIYSGLGIYDNVYYDVAAAASRYVAAAGASILAFNNGSLVYSTAPSGAAAAAATLTSVFSIGNTGNITGNGVANTVSNSGATSFNVTSTTNSVNIFMQANGSGSVAYFGTTSAHNVALIVGSSPIGYLTASGIGINTSSVSHNLEVNGTANVNNTLTAGTAFTFMSMGGNGTDGAYAQFYKDSSASFVGSVGTGLPGAASPVSGLVFGTYTGSWTERMRLTSTGLGIGTSSISHALEVNGTANVSGALTVQGVSSTFSNSGGTSLNVTSTTNSVNIFMQANGAGGIAYMGTTSAHNVGMAVNNTIIGTWASTGLGIGMVPTNIFDITQNTAGNANANLYNPSTGTSATACWTMSNSAVGAGASGMFLFGHGYTSSGMNRADGVMLQSSNAGGLSLHAAGTYPIYFGINGSEVGRWTSTGLSILTTTGGYALNVNGTVNFNSSLSTTGSVIMTGSGRLNLGGAVDSSGIVHTIYQQGKSWFADRVGVNTLSGGPFANGSLCVATASGNTIGIQVTAGNAAGDVGMEVWIPASNGTTGKYMTMDYASNGTIGVITVTGGGSGVGYTSPSDERLKDLLPDHMDFRSAIKDLRVGSFRKFGDFDKKGDGHVEMGVIAQQAYDLLGGFGVAKPANENDKWLASSEPFAFLALWGVKDQYKMIEELTARVAELELKLAA